MMSKGLVVLSLVLAGGILNTSFAFGACHCSSDKRPGCTGAVLWEEGTDYLDIHVNTKQCAIVFYQVDGSPMSTTVQGGRERENLLFLQGQKNISLSNTYPNECFVCRDDDFPWEQSGDSLAGHWVFGPIQMSFAAGRIAGREVSRIADANAERTDYYQGSYSDDGKVRFDLYSSIEWFKHPEANDSHYNDIHCDGGLTGDTIEVRCQGSGKPFGVQMTRAN